MIDRSPAPSIEHTPQPNTLGQVGSRPNQPLTGAPRLYLRDDELLIGISALFDVASTLRQLSDAARRDAGLTAADIAALIAIAVAPAPVSTIADRLGVTGPTLSRTLDGLQARGFLIREQSPTDKRQLVPSLTETGRGVLDTLTKPMRTRLAAAYREAGDEAVAGSDAVLAAIVRGQGVR
jgi:DNA-binding MarR family transcriptional regulator